MATRTADAGERLATPASLAREPLRRRRGEQAPERVQLIGRLLGELRIKGRLAVDVQRSGQGRGAPLLEDGSALGGELVAGPAGATGVKRRSVALDLVPRTARHGRLVALLTPVGVEERPETRRGRERAVEHGATLGEAVALGGREAGEGIAGLRPTARTDGSEGEPYRPRECRPLHGERAAPSVM